MLAEAHDDPPPVIVFLVKNVESLVAAAANALNQTPPRKDPSERDRVLMRASEDPTARQAVMAQVPSFGELVTAVTDWWQRRSA